MDQNRWKIVRTLFHEVLELPAAERDELLSSCGEGEDVVAEVRDLLAHHEDSPTLLEEPFASFGDRGPRPAGRIGPWEILRTLGRGGMGTVFLAKRADGAYRGHVAIKLLHPELASKEWIERFRRERQILADLEHPSIARLIDGGQDDEGRLYLAMEYVEGEPLDVYCDRCGLGIEQRLELFQQVARAVHFAHQNLIVHRDIKPSNIFAIEGGKLKLLDFGIAKLLEEGREEAPPDTMTGMAPMTPEFASPEQMQGRPVTTASDVYSLGVLLYVLLTGFRPFRLTELAPQAFIEAVCSKESPAASQLVAEMASREPERMQQLAEMRASEPARLRKSLAGDLDKILAKALRKEPRERYLSAEEMAQDLERYLEGRPVLAREPTLGYRAGKFLHRHRLGVSLAVAVLLALSSLSVGLLIQRSRILKERARGEEVTRFLEGLFEVSDPDRARGDQVKARELLDRGALDIRARLRDQPELQAKLLATMGRVYRQLGLFEEAGPLLQDAQQIRAQLYGPGHRETAEGYLDLGEQAFALGSYQEAAGDFAAGLQIFRQLGDAGEKEIRALSGLSLSYQLLGDYARAEQELEEANELATAILGPGHELLAQNQVQLGSLLREQGQFDAAEGAYEKALELYRSLYGEQHPKVARLLGHLGLLYDEQGFYEKAEESFRAALEMQSRLFTADHPEIATTRKNLAALFDHRGLYPEATEQAKQALASLERIFGGKSSSVAEVLNLLGLIRQHAGDLEVAESYLRRSIAMWADQQGEDYLLIAAARANLGSVLQEQGHFDSAEVELAEALALYRKAFGPRHLQVATLLNNLAVLHRKQGDLEGARRGYEESLEITRQLLGPDHQNVATLAHNLAVVLQLLGQPEAAEPAFREALAVYSRILPEGNVNLGVIRKNLAASLVAQGKLEEGRNELTEAFSIFERNALPPENTVVLAARGILGEVHMKKGELAEAEKVLVEVFEIARKNFAEGSPELSKARERLALLYRLMRRPDKASAYAGT